MLLFHSSGNRNKWNFWTKDNGVPERFGTSIEAGIWRSQLLCISHSETLSCRPTWPAEMAKQLFAGTNVSICAGKHCLGAAIGSKSFTEEYVRNKVYTWVEEVKCIAATHLHSAYSAFTHGLPSQWTFVSRTMLDIQNLLVSLEHAIHEFLLPALTGRPSCSSLESSYLAYQPDYSQSR